MKKNKINLSPRQKEIREMKQILLIEQEKLDHLNEWIYKNTSSPDYQRAMDKKNALQVRIYNLQTRINNRELFQPEYGYADAPAGTAAPLGNPANYARVPGRK
ncbi:hypothetical protein [Nodularia spumigena]|jgi:hypothetical protein|uniref:hypothetical protein n=1 Tax=Nodularia spumigena TaxID=70799 RepID=UPI00232F6F9E|nr:hypothetical protein [Nodularia spumigena]MDB9500042.1 hypothetical protein [Nodularia spumigena CS-336/02]